MDYLSEHLNEIIDTVIESFFLHERWGQNSLESHYLKHVLQDNAYWNYNGNISDPNEPDHRRVLMPPMSLDEYNAKAITLATENHFSYIDNWADVVGFKNLDLKYADNYTGKYSDDKALVDKAGRSIKEVCIKIKRHSDYEIYDNEVDDETYYEFSDFEKYGKMSLYRYSEIVVYINTTIKSDPLIHTYAMTKAYNGNVSKIIKHNRYTPSGPLAKNESLKGSPAEMLLAMDDLEN